ncbi:MAG: methyltransferase domain-containing protein [Alphaproteobacteria bacterium]|nr:methyltransferase domain-containing protein [Alphaproteobacteria bacterium]MBU6473355.1 methyltransferase domain-containing protein [Alphaproteobacteria bacterium]MDE2014205.1 class I SAM-dependent methyltransferase [Alphaproteobacteria bacterium]MDE2072437.1 class I SAM-dependent methyltransferase [Alphaproteobacteria bacterium]MDE2352585.1 class I SAM-dependent methyltransferase [Alphaproteobacteria bacterium]
MRLIKYFQDDTSALRLSWQLRCRRARMIEAMIRRAYQENGRCRILDVGGEIGYWKVIDRASLESCGVRIVCLNPKLLESEDALIDTVVGDGCNLPFDDQSFDIVHSNSVIEHVGDWRQVRSFARETRRVGRRYYVQTPNFWFPVEPHYSALFVHWFPEPVRARLLMSAKRGFFPKAENVSRAVETVQSARLLDRKMFGYLFPDAVLHDEKLLGMTKSLIAIRM